MAGNKGVAIVLQDRDRQLLRQLDWMRVIDREQARIIGPFGSVTRANTRLLGLASAGLLARLTVGTVRGGHKHLYARTRAGAAIVDQQYRVPPWNAQLPIIAGQPLLEHQLRLNALWLALKGNPDIRLEDWRTFLRPPVTSAPAVIPDAYALLRHRDVSRPMFVEIDLATEPLKTWMRKAERYFALARSGGFEPTFHQPQFGVAVALPSMARLHSVRQAIAPVTTKLFFLTSFEMAAARPWSSSIWWRPVGDQPVSIF